jgi:hypothetical protein
VKLSEDDARQLRGASLADVDLAAADGDETVCADVEPRAPIVRDDEKTVAQPRPEGAVVLRQVPRVGARWLKGIDVSSARGWQRRRCVHRSPKGSQDARIHAAAADIALHGSPHVRVGSVRATIEQRCAGEDHSRSAVAALKGRLVQECTLQRVEPVSGGEPLDRRDIVADRIGQGGDACADDLAFEKHRADAAHALGAAELCAGEVQLLAEDVEERSLRLEGDLMRHPVDDDRGHGE